MITTEMKIKKTKKSIKCIIFASSFYLAICVAAIFDALLVRPNEDMDILSAPLIVLYSLGILSISILTFNIMRFHNVNMIRKKAIHDYDERNALVQEKTNTFTLQFICFSLVLGFLLSIYLNSIELFAFCFILILLIIFCHIITKIIINKKI